MAKPNLPTSQPTDDGPVGASQTKILKNLSKRLTDDYFNQKNFPLRTAGLKNEPNEVQAINQYISQKSQHLSNQTTDPEAVKPASASAPQDFNGLSGPAEEQALLAEQVRHLERENLKLKHQLDLLSTDYQTEKRQLSATIRDLKTELHRTAPLTENKFFTFSKDLREVVQAVKNLSDDEVLAPATEETDLPEPLPAEPPPAVPALSPVPPFESPSAAEPKIVSQPDTTGSNPPPAKPKLTKKTKTIAAAATAVAIFTIGISLTLFGRKPAVDQALVDSYLNADGTVAGASATAEPDESNSPQVRKEFKNNDVSFADTDWQVFRDEFLGFQVRYPANVTDLLHTGNTITFLRHDGYIFKMQRIATDQPLKDYWEQAKANGLNYLLTPVELGPHEAYHLVLDEPVEYPGNRYLVQLTGHIADVWYATDSAKLSADDRQRVEYMVNSMRFL